MRQILYQLLRCPKCLEKLEAKPFVESRDGKEVIEGLLNCGCGASYPIVNTIPRMLHNAFELFPDFVLRYRDRMGDRLDVGRINHPAKRFDILVSKTRESFGYQWTTFSEMVCDFRENFWNYLYPATPNSFKGRLGLDVGCGFGRHIYHAASCGAEMVGVDLSRAIDATYQNTKQFPNVHLVQADIYALPFAAGTFDFVYSIGVLHHLPDPERGVKAIAPLLRPGGALYVWLYSSTRQVSNFLLEVVRLLTTRLPHPVVNGISFLGALVDRYVLILPYQLLRRAPLAGRLFERLTPPRIKLYSQYPFQVLYADWFDRLAAPIRFYYSEQQVQDILLRAGVIEVQTSPTGYYGWRGCGVLRHPPVQGLEPGRT